MKNKMKIIALTLASVLVFSCSKSSEPAVVESTAYSIAATLNNANEPVSANTGTVTGSYDWTTKILTISIMHTLASTSITAGHIHQGHSGTNGGVVFPFLGSLITPIAQTFTLNASQEAALTGGDFYVNLHSTSAPTGEIRGQLAVSTAGLVTGILNGANEVLSTSMGSVTGTYDTATKALSITTTHTLGTNATAAHIHAGLAGANGAVIFPFVAPITSPNTQTTVLTTTQEASLMATGLYVNIHTASYPSGEIRGQLIAAKK